MPNYIDTYISSPDQTSLANLAAGFVAATPIMPGRAAIAEDDTTTPPTLAKPQVGDPSLFYVLIRSTFNITPLIASPMQIVDAVTGAAIVGVFA